MVVLNQADRLTPAEVDQCRADLVRLMERDGVPRATVLATSVATGAGLDELRQRLANAVAGRTAARARPRRRRARRGRRPRWPRRTLGDGGGCRRHAPSCSTPSPAAPGSPPSSRPWPATTAWSRPPAPGGRSLGGCTGCGRGRCDACASTGATSPSPPPTCARCSAAPRSRPRRPPRGPPSTSRPAGSPTGPGATSRCRGPRPLERAATPPGDALGDALDQAVVGTSLHARAADLVAGGRRGPAGARRGGAGRAAVAGALRRARTPPARPRRGGAPDVGCRAGAARPARRRGARRAAPGPPVAVVRADRRPAPRPGHGPAAACLDRHRRAGPHRAAGRAGARAPRGDAHRAQRAADV